MHIPLVAVVMSKQAAPSKGTTHIAELHTVEARRCKTTQLVPGGRCLDCASYEECSINLELVSPHDSRGHKDHSKESYSDTEPSLELFSIQYDGGYGELHGGVELTDYYNESFEGYRLEDSGVFEEYSDISELYGFYQDGSSHKKDGDSLKLAYIHDAESYKENSNGLPAACDGETVKENDASLEREDLKMPGSSYSGDYALLCDTNGNLRLDHSVQQR